MTATNPFEIERPIRMIIELEQFIVDRAHEPIPFEGERGAQSLFERVASEFPQQERDTSGSVLRAYDDKKSASIDEHGKLHLTLGPFEDVGEFRIELETFQRAMFQLLLPANVRVLAIGCLAASVSGDVPTLDALAGTSIEIKYTQDVNLEHAYALAKSLAPLFALLCDNTPAGSTSFEPHNLIRARVMHELSHDLLLENNAITLNVADAMPAPFVTAYAALVKGILSTEESIAAANSKLGHIDDSAREQAWEALARDGFDAMIYGMPAGELAEELLDCAQETLASNEHNYLSPLRQIARSRKTLASMVTTRR